MMNYPTLIKIAENIFPAMILGGLIGAGGGAVLESYKDKTRKDYVRALLAGSIIGAISLAALDLAGSINKMKW